MMKKDKNLHALAAMFVLTVAGAALSFWPNWAMLLLSVFLLKSFLVSSFFMELRHAHPIWKFALMAWLSLIFGVVLVLGG